MRVARQALALVLEGLPDNIPAEQTLKQFYKQNPHAGKKDRTFIRDIIFSTLRWAGWLDQLNLSPEEKITLAAQLDHLPYPLDKRCPLPIKLPPKGTLQEKAKQLELAPESLAPDWITPYLIPQATQQIDAFYTWLQERPPVHLRVSLQARENLQKNLQKTEKNIHPSSHFFTAYQTQNRAAANRLTQAFPGAIEPQNLASQLVAWVCEPKAGEPWWDVCAGAGGKSLHLADLMEYQGRILATEPRKKPLRSFKQRLKQNPAKTTLIRIRQQNVLSHPLPKEKFKGVLLDAPCTGWGNWSRMPDARWRATPEAITRAAQRQTKLLHKVAPAVQVGGRLVYAVCTLTQQETEDVINAFLKTHPEFALDAFPHPLTGRQTTGTFHALPWETEGDGMFIAVLRKKHTS